ncbi:RNA-binding protein [Halapricum hydrolyticum]|uniref:RNA-binding protein n=1 Tax=Halapricum hydrolyticum TaxID=2979991 RepID=A0AAE3I8H8_9EURY|nr:RNA-binding protein [Halapricum hydrolyticum]MCU4716760.1 RNA-binding protein [Halapricum hydrolyticum]MCU4725635.1 RNA-binding protein [Halapricum hydrolyticum]
MSSVPLHYIDLRTFCYATEDEKRVEDALRTLLPEEFELQRLENEGHHGDRILVFSARVENADAMRVVLDRLGELPSEQRQQLLGELDERVTDNTELFLTLDKQAAFGGDVRLGDGITVRAKVEAYPATKDAAVENARDVLESL